MDRIDQFIPLVDEKEMELVDFLKQESKPPSPEELKAKLEKRKKIPKLSQSDEE